MKAMFSIWDILLLFFMSVLIGFCVGGLVWTSFEKWRMVEEATKHGHGHYFLDKDNERRWEWLPRCG